ncbi:hypothetical protein HAL_35120 [Haladaptatus sp. T7]|nr:hypothetical protein HAL_35120 [Haladaptatus sp. T7]
MIRNLREFVTAHPWAYALPAGLISSAYVLINSPGSSALDFGVIFWPGLVGGVVTLSGKKEARRIGFQTGLVGSVPILWNAIPTVGAILRFDQPMSFGALEVLVVFVLVAFVALMVGLSGAIAAMTGEWLSRKLGSGEPTPVTG